MMPVPTWTTGQVLTASDVNSWLRPFAIHKTADTTRTSTTTLTDDPHLTLAVVASATYIIELVMLYEAGTTEDLKWTLTVPTGTTWDVMADQFFTTAAGLGDILIRHQSEADAPVVFGGIGAANPIAGSIKGVLVTSSTAGSVTLQWAQNTSGAVSTILRTGSFLSLTRIA